MQYFLVSRRDAQLKYSNLVQLSHTICSLWKRSVLIESKSPRKLHWKLDSIITHKG